MQLCKIAYMYFFRFYKEELHFMHGSIIACITDFKFLFVCYRLMTEIRIYSILMYESLPYHWQL